MTIGNEEFDEPSKYVSIYTFRYKEMYHNNDKINKYF